MGRAIYVLDIVPRWHTLKIIRSMSFNYTKVNSFYYVINVKNEGIDIRPSIGGKFVEKKLLLIEWLVYGTIGGVGKKRGLKYRKRGLRYRRGGDWPPLLGRLGGLGGLGSLLLGG